MEPFLRATEIIDWNNPSVRSKALELAKGTSGDLGIAQRCFEWVRDKVLHSSDYKRNPVTCTASEVLAAGTGYCYAKSHLLAALLRANGIPAGFCYQLSIDDQGASYSLHGLNAIYLAEFGWYRVDSRGNKPGVNAQFCPPEERLAFSLNFPEERNFSEILPEPLPVVVNALRTYSTWDQVYRNLPDWDHPTLL
jgi:transglutaminase-like putative cysteine protease